MSYIWIPSLHSGLPVNAIECGTDPDGKKMYLGRTVYENEQIPGKVNLSKSVIIITYGGHVIEVDQYDILCGNGFSWIPYNNENGIIHENAIVGGKTSDNEQLYIGRGFVNGGLIVGKVQLSKNCLYVVYDGQESTLTDFEILIHHQSQWCLVVNKTDLPEGAIEGGHDTDGGIIYIGRANYKNDQLPVKVIPCKGAAYISNNGEEYPVNDYEVLCNGNTYWQEFVGYIPENAVRGGRTEDDETLYIGRGSYAGSLTVGKIQPSCGCLFIPFGGEEIELDHFQILIED